MSDVMVPMPQLLKRGVTAGVGYAFALCGKMRALRLWILIDPLFCSKHVRKFITRNLNAVLCFRNQVTFVGLDSGSDFFGFFQTTGGCGHYRGCRCRYGLGLFAHYAQHFPSVFGRSDLRQSHLSNGYYHKAKQSQRAGSKQRDSKPYFSSFFCRAKQTGQETQNSQRDNNPANYDQNYKHALGNVKILQRKFPLKCIQILDQNFIVGKLA